MSVLQRSLASAPSSRGRIAHRLVGVGFATAALGNAVGTLPQATSFLSWLAEGAWLPSYRWLLTELVTVAADVDSATAAFEAAVAAMLIIGGEIATPLDAGHALGRRAYPGHQLAVLAGEPAAPRGNS